MKKIEFKERDEERIIDFIHKNLGGEIINDNQIVFDNDIVKGQMMVHEEPEYRVTAMDYTAKKATEFKIHHDIKYDLSVHLFLNGVELDQGKKKLVLNLPNGFIFLKNEEHFNLKYKEGERKFILTYAINYEKYKINEVMKKLLNLGNYIFHTGNEHIMIWKKSVSEKMRSDIDPIIKRAWIRVKLTELKLLVDNILLHIDDKKDTHLFSNY
ncbi:hypothetical protein [Flammeovirga kamogawensis]|uniref:Transcription regulator HTH AraC- type ligand binding domain-containing protein n=1 Tax=Flammeovirga kamogawensis TaxID=373891 RepID=A0ABX8GVB5_9BACT|nr:hypothetical protein [Flammeovirga kamogawensis]MBB6459670.1 hypothetical protein [Flammeovirga kamogawensis]QWG07268.1 hypothetical protein KM029_18490 [Flammeovirga kamogawensis]TRX69088.1 hypothetical protein EO216_13480 [Flammeovirga kamogawensis]